METIDHLDELLAETPKPTRDEEFDAFVAELVLLGRADTSRAVTVNIHGLPLGVFEREDVTKVGLRRHHGGRCYLHGDLTFGPYLINLFSADFTEGV